MESSLPALCMVFFFAASSVTEALSRADHHGGKVNLDTTISPPADAAPSQMLLGASSNNRHALMRRNSDEDPLSHTAESPLELTHLGVSDALPVPKIDKDHGTSQRAPMEDALPVAKINKDHVTSQRASMKDTISDAQIYKDHATSQRELMEEAGILKAAYIPRYRSEMLAQGTLTDGKLETERRSATSHSATEPQTGSVMQEAQRGFPFWGHLVKRDTDASILQVDPMVHPPSTEGYALEKGTDKESYSQFKQDLILLPILGPLGKGFFVESGALDGEKDSNSLYYELKLGWSGLLVEPDHTQFPKLQAKHRHAYTFNGCLSPHEHAETLQFAQDTTGYGGLSHLNDPTSEAGRQNTISYYTVQARPLHDLIKAAGQSTVDFWSLDIEGSEGAVLKATDFSKVEVGVLLIEMNKNDGNNKEVRDVMNREGFKVIGHSNYDGGVLDHIFINPQYFQKRNLPVPTSELLEAQYRD